ncbi:hypothetical protein GCM10008908_18180 [Clostridium subterminale]|uniref:Putative zinc-finger domain-containing protein n=1 Tax=Clostridium subterminale TaxID=1550 RepID=A0ABN1KNR9_CLOSU
MKCSQCKDKLTEYIEGNLSAEADEEMRSHLLTCQSCKDDYDKEVLEYKAFKEAFSYENINFKNSTSKIIESIDKNKYTKGRRGVRRKYKGGLAIAAAFLLGVIVTPVAMKLMNGKEMLSAASSGIEDKAAKQDETSKTEVKDENISKETKENVPDVASSDEKVIDNVKMSSNVNIVGLYSKTEVSIDKKLTFNTPFIATADGKYEASIEGKGENAIEEGIGILYIKDTSTNKMYEYTATEKESQQSPLSISWYDDTHIMIVHGLGYGTLVNGERIVILDVTTGEQMLIATAKDKERFVSITRENDSLILKYVLYLDDMMNDKEDKSKTFDNYILGDVIEGE